MKKKRIITRYLVDPSKIVNDILTENGAACGTMEYEEAVQRADAVAKSVLTTEDSIRLFSFIKETYANKASEEKPQEPEEDVVEKESPKKKRKFFKWGLQ